MVSAVRSAVVIVAFALLVPAPSRASMTPPPGVRVPLVPVAGGWAIAVHVGGRQLRLLLDTGSSRSYVRREVAVSLDLRPRARFEIVDAAGSSVGVCAGPVPIRLGAFVASVECLSWRPGPAPGEAALLPRGIDGILGADAFAGGRVLIDPGSGSLTVGGPELDAWIDGTEAVSGVSEGRFWIELRTVANRAGSARALRLVVDSGTDRTLLFGAAARAHARAPNHTSSALRLETLGGTRSAHAVRLPQLVSGNWRLRGGSALLLPEVRDRQEDGVVPLSGLGAVYLDASTGRVVLGARLRTTPPRPATMVAAR
jgi:predicted aspartyl protease